MDTSQQELVEFDIRGQICPSTLLMALREVNRRKAELKAGKVRLLFKTDSRDATSTIPDAISHMGYMVKVDKADGHYTIVIGMSV